MMKRLCERVGTLELEWIKALSDAELEQLVADAPDWIVEATDAELQAIIDGTLKPRKATGGEPSS